MVRTSHRRCSVRNGVLRNFAKFTGKHLCQSLLLNKVTGLRPATLLKKRFWHTCFPMNFATFSRTPFLQNTSLGGCFYLVCFISLINSCHILWCNWFINAVKLDLHSLKLMGVICNRHNFPYKRQPHKIVKNTLKQFLVNLPTTSCLSVFDHFVGLALKGWNYFHCESRVQNFLRHLWWSFFAKMSIQNF